MTRTDVVIFDGECDFCRAQIRILKRLDPQGHLQPLSAHDPETAALFPELTRGELMRHMYVVTAGGNRLAGADAIRYLSRRLKLLWPIAPILNFPGTSRLWRWLYGQVARRRYALGRSNKVCERPDPD